MSTPERLSSVPDPDRSTPRPEGGSEPATTPTHATSRRVERRFEIGLFVRKRIKRHLVFYREWLLARSRRSGSESPEQPRSPAPPPPSVHAEAGPGGRKRAFALEAGETEGTGSPDPNVLPAGAIGEDDGGPIHGVSFEIGGFAGVTTETTTDET